MCEVLKVLKTDDSPSISAIRDCLFSGCLRSSPQEFLSAHLPLSKSGLNPVQVPPGPLNPLYCVSQDRRIRHVPLIPPLYCTPVQPEALLGVHLVGVMWRVPAIWTKITIYAHNQRNWAFSQVNDKSVTQCIHRQGQSKQIYVFS